MAVYEEVIRLVLDTQQADRQIESINRRINGIKERARALDVSGLDASVKNVEESLGTATSSISSALETIGVGITGISGGLGQIGVGFTEMSKMASIAASETVGWLKTITVELYKTTVAAENLATQIRMIPPPPSPTVGPAPQPSGTPPAQPIARAVQEGTYDAVLHGAPPSPEELARDLGYTVSQGRVYGTGAVGAIVGSKKLEDFEREWQEQQGGMAALSFQANMSPRPMRPVGQPPPPREALEDFLVSKFGNIGASLVDDFWPVTGKPGQRAMLGAINDVYGLNYTFDEISGGINRTVADVGVQWSEYTRGLGTIGHGATSGTKFARWSGMDVLTEREFEALMAVEPAIPEQITERISGMFRPTGDPYFQYEPKHRMIGSPHFSSWTGKWMQTPYSPEVLRHSYAHELGHAAIFEYPEQFAPAYETLSIMMREQGSRPESRLAFMDYTRQSLIESQAARHLGTTEMIDVTAGKPATITRAGSLMIHETIANEIAAVMGFPRPGVEYSEQMNALIFDKLRAQIRDALGRISDIPMEAIHRERVWPSWRMPYYGDREVYSLGARMDKLASEMAESETPLIASAPFERGGQWYYRQPGPRSGFSRGFPTQEAAEQYYRMFGGVDPAAFRQQQAIWNQQFMESLMPREDIGRFWRDDPGWSITDLERQAAQAPGYFQPGLRQATYTQPTLPGFAPPSQVQLGPPGPPPAWPTPQVPQRPPGMSVAAWNAAVSGGFVGGQQQFWQHVAAGTPVSATPYWQYASATPPGQPPPPPQWFQQLSPTPPSRRNVQQANQFADAIGRTASYFLRWLIVWELFSFITKTLKEMVQEALQIEEVARRVSIITGGTVGQGINYVTDAAVAGAQLGIQPAQMRAALPGAAAYGIDPVYAAMAQRAFGIDTASGIQQLQAATYFTGWSPNQVLDLASGLYRQAPNQSQELLQVVAESGLLSQMIGIDTSRIAYAMTMTGREMGTSPIQAATAMQRLSTRLPDYMAESYIGSWGQMGRGELAETLVDFGIATERGGRQTQVMVEMIYQLSRAMRTSTGSIDDMIETLMEADVNQIEKAGAAIKTAIGNLASGADIGGMVQRGVTSVTGEPDSAAMGRWEDVGLLYNAYQSIFSGRMLKNIFGMEGEGAEVPLKDAMEVAWQQAEARGETGLDLFLAPLKLLFSGELRETYLEAAGPSTTGPTPGVPGVPGGVAYQGAPGYQMSQMLARQPALLEFFKEPAAAMMGAAEADITSTYFLQTVAPQMQQQFDQQINQMLAQMQSQYGMTQKQVQDFRTELTKSLEKQGGIAEFADQTMYLAGPLWQYYQMADQAGRTRLDFGWEKDYTIAEFDRAWAQAGVETRAIERQYGIKFEEHEFIRSFEDGTKQYVGSNERLTRALQLLNDTLTGTWNIPEGQMPWIPLPTYQLVSPQAAQLAARATGGAMPQMQQSVPDYRLSQATTATPTQTSGQVFQSFLPIVTRQTATSQVGQTPPELPGRRGRINYPGDSPGTEPRAHVGVTPQITVSPSISVDATIYCTIDGERIAATVNRINVRSIRQVGRPYTTTTMIEGLQQ